MKHNFKYRYTPKRQFNKPTDFGTFPTPEELEKRKINREKLTKTAMILHKDLFCEEVRGQVNWALIDEKGNHVCTAHGKDEEEVTAISDYLCNISDLDNAILEPVKEFTLQDILDNITKHPEDAAEILDALETNSVEYLKFSLVAKLLKKKFIAFS